LAKALVAVVPLPKASELIWYWSCWFGSNNFVRYISQELPVDNRL